MKTTLMAAVLLLGSTCFAQSQESPGDNPGDTFDWRGAYIGATAGYGWGTANVVDGQYNGGFDRFPVLRFGVASSGFIGGLHFGYNWQNGRFVGGVEGELGYLGPHGDAFPPFTDPDGFPYDTSGVISGGWYAGLTGRLGYAFKDTLLFGKGGLLYAAATVAYRDACDGGPSCGPGTLEATAKLGPGFRLGAGIEHALSEHWTVRVDYDYLNFGTVGMSGVVSGGGFDGLTMNSSMSLSAHAVRFGISYKF